MKIGLNMTTGVMSVVGKKTLYKVTILVILGLVCFKESEFQEFTYFPMFGNHPETWSKEN
jgi:hypothetical protein